MIDSEFHGAKINIFAEFETHVENLVENLVEKNGRMWEKMEKYLTKQDLNVIVMKVRYC